MSIFKKSVLVPASAFLACGIVCAAEIPANGSFEKGLAGYWVNRPAAVKIETGKAPDGKKYAVVDPGKEKVINLVFHTSWQAGKVYRVSFDAASTGEKDGPVLKAALMLQGKTPICFYSGTTPAEKKALSSPFALTAEWKTFTFQVGPIPEKVAGQNVRTLMFYFNATPGKTPGKIRIDKIRVSVEDLPKAAAPAAKK